MSQPLELVCVDPAEVHKVWPHARSLIVSAILATDLSDRDDIECAILDGDQLLWLATDGEHIHAAAATHLTKVNGSKVCTLTACGGVNMHDWLPLFSKIEQYAKNEGCTRVRIYGRKGWSRVLEGYHATHVVMERTL